MKAKDKKLTSKKKRELFMRKMKTSLNPDLFAFYDPVPLHNVYPKQREFKIFDLKIKQQPIKRDIQELIEYQRKNLIKRDRILEKNRHNLIYIDRKLAERYD